jgi:pimeloyl-ACP methyl ester carboxylesterase
MGTTDRLRAAYADCRFGQVHYLARRGDSRLAPLVLLNPRSRTGLRLLPFVEAERPVYIVDIPAYGASSPPTGSCTMLEVAEAVAAALDHAGAAPAHLFGLHTGAKVAAALAENWPDRARSLTVGGKSHSLVPGRDQRNIAMRQQVAARKPDFVLIGMESYVADEPERAAGTALVYEANFAFDFKASLERIKCPILIIEIVSDDEDARLGRQARAMAAGCRLASTAELPETDQTGIDLYVGAGRMAEILLRFIAHQEGVQR